MRIFWKFWEFRSGQLKKKKKGLTKNEEKTGGRGRGRGLRGHAMNLIYYFIEIYFHLVYADFISG